MSLDPLQHAALAKRLVNACGGVAAIIEVGACRAGRSQLYAYQSKDDPQTMPAAVIDELEDYCGQAIYSRVLCQRRGVVAAENLLSAASEADFSASDFQRALISFLCPGSDGGSDLSPNERAELARIYQGFLSKVLTAGATLTAQAARDSSAD